MTFPNEKKSNGGEKGRKTFEINQESTTSDLEDSEKTSRLYYKLYG